MNDIYSVSLIEGFEESGGFYGEIRAQSHSDAARAIVRQVPYIRGFPADVTNERTGDSVEIDL